MSLFIFCFNLISYQQGWKIVSPQNIIGWTENRNVLRRIYKTTALAAFIPLSIKYTSGSFYTDIYQFSFHRLVLENLQVAQVSRSTFCAFL